MDLGHAAVIPGQKPKEHIRKVEAGGAVYAPHNPEIDDSDRPLGVHEHVSGMEIGMEKTVAENLVEESSGSLAEDLLDPVSGSEKPHAVIDANPVDPLYRKHGAAGARPVDTGNAEARIAGEIFPELSGSRGLQPKIHLEPNDLGEGLNDLDRLKPAQPRDQ